MRLIVKCVLLFAVFGFILAHLRSARGIYEPNEVKWSIESSVKIVDQLKDLSKKLIDNSRSIVAWKIGVCIRNLQHSMETLKFYHHHRIHNDIPSEVFDNLKKNFEEARAFIDMYGKEVTETSSTTEEEDQKDGDNTTLLITTEEATKKNQETIPTVEETREDEEDTAVPTGETTEDYEETARSAGDEIDNDDSNEKENDEIKEEEESDEEDDDDDDEDDDDNDEEFDKD